MDKVKARVQRKNWGDGVEVLLKLGNAIGANIVFEEHNDNRMCQPTFSLDSLEAQLLMDELWEAGLRPSEGSGSAGAMAATQRHLEDMRSLVFKSPLVSMND